jgi:periplasmic protein TonB
MGLPPAQDRMLTTCFLAALFHGIVILGVSFSLPPRDEALGQAPAMEVVLVNNNDQDFGVPVNSNAKYLSQHNHRGAGNARKHERTLIPKSSLMPVDRAGIPGGAGMDAAQNGREAGDADQIATYAPSQKIVYFASPTAADQPSELPLLLENRPDLGLTPNDDGIELHLRGEARNQLWIAADTRESEVAVYLDNWRRKIERVGTVNFPDAVRRQKLSGTPVIEVIIGADGKLLQSVIRRTSGHPEIDAAALRILKLAAPYDAFPAGLNATHDEIRIAYEWQFLGGAERGSGVFYNDGGDASVPQ